MDADMAEIMPKARLHKGPGNRVEWSAGRSHNFRNDGRNGTIVSIFGFEIRHCASGQKRHFGAFVTFSDLIGRAVGCAVSLQGAVTGENGSGFRVRLRPA
jgi:hypothetical protein